ncbi:MAG: AbiV family abortive infection protein [Candidatus Nitrosoabyssus spongiisocia]|nr:MAG: AbiV family abortive infection protein [Nitrosopumilaceae archaeon AB1(1)]
MSDGSKIHIFHREIWDGIRHSSKYAKSLMDHSDILRKNCEYQSAISLACLSFEESSKCAQLCKFHFEKKDITKDYWDNNLHSHKGKTKYFTEQLLSQQSLTRDEYEQTIKGLKNTAITYDQQTSSHYANLFKKLDIYARNFHKLKLLCFYSNWDETNKKWISFEDIPDKEHLADFVIDHSKMFRYLSMFNVERLVVSDFTLVPDIKYCSKCNKICMDTDKCSNCNIVQLDSDSEDKDQEQCNKAMNDFIKNFAPKIK